MRIAVGGIHTENSTFNPLLTRLNDFRVLRGEALANHPEFAALAELEGFTILPTLHARALAGGSVAPEAYGLLKDEFLERLQAALPLDGVWMAMHGAMHVRGMDDAEGDWITAVRDLVGPETILIGSFDLHGNISPRITQALDGLTAYRTAPHVDVHETHLRAVRMLRDALTKGLRPKVVWVPIPVLLPGERTSTEDEPARSLYRSLSDFDARHGVWDASLFVGYVWADEPRSTAAAVATGTDVEAITRTAQDVARSYWDARHAFTFGSRHGDLDEMVEVALAESSRPGAATLVIVADSGDNPTAGGVGDRADALSTLMERGAKDVLVAGIAAPEATRACFEAGVGANVCVAIGGQLAMGTGPTVRAEVQVVRLVGAPDSCDSEALVRHDGISVILSARRRPYHHLADFERLHAPLNQFGILVVKSGYLAPELAPLANPSLLAISPGVVTQHIAALDHQRLARSFFPIDPDTEWVPAQEPKPEGPGTPAPRNKAATGGTEPVTPRVGLVGAGAMALVHLNSWRAAGIEPVGIVASRPASTQAFATSHGLRPFHELDDLLSTCDAVDLCVPSDLHVPFALRAVRAGCDVVCEKPLALSVAEGTSLIDACRRHGLRLLVAHVLRFFPAYRRAQQLVAAGEVGQVRHMDLQRTSTVAAEGWFRDFDRSGGLPLDLLIHDVDYACWLLGEPNQVRREAVIVPTEYPDAERVRLHLAWSSGATAVLDGSWNLPSAATQFRIEGDRGVLCGQSGRLTFASSERPDEERVIQVPDDKPYELQAQHLARALKGEEDFEVSPEEALRAVAVCVRA